MFAYFFLQPILIYMIIFGVYNIQVLLTASTLYFVDLWWLSALLCLITVVVFPYLLFRKSTASKLILIGKILALWFISLIEVLLVFVISFDITEYPSEWRAQLLQTILPQQEIALIFITIFPLVTHIVLSLISTLAYVLLTKFAKWTINAVRLSGKAKLSSN